ncbi:MAG TPA: dTMP kinase [Acidimicrobiales bacterium]|nr:dTMP kinase [Acidimicrobiales bacterium]
MTPSTEGGPGRFIVFEGGEACGKTTQASALAARIGAVLTREPGGTSVGRAIRSVVLDPAAHAVDERTEALLMAADRAQHVAELIRPTLHEGRHVVSDRYIGSSLAYQGHGRGLPLADIERLSSWATGGLQPDLVVLLDLPVEVARERRRDATDRMEAEDAVFHRRVRDGFLTLAEANDEVWIVLDASRSVEEVMAAVSAVVVERLGLDGPDGAGTT